MAATVMLSPQTLADLRTLYESPERSNATVLCLLDHIDAQAKCLAVAQDLARSVLQENGIEP